MQIWKRIGMVAITAAFLAPITGCRGTRVGVSIGPTPDCPYGYYAVPPYDCAPDGFYGPDWFVNGVFIGAGPWYRGPRHFHGHVDRHYDIRHGYHGPFPQRGEHPSPHRREFHGHSKGNPHSSHRGHQK
jgi:hypothetical protein